jgi:predicted component of type VI protein secretion system
MVDSLLASSRKARRWDALVELYGDLAVEAEQDFWRIFEKEFLQAYRAGQQDRRREAAAAGATSGSRAR